MDSAYTENLRRPGDMRHQAQSDPAIKGRHRLGVAIAMALTGAGRKKARARDMEQGHPRCCRLMASCRERSPRAAKMVYWLTPDRGRDPRHNTILWRNPHVGQHVGQSV